MLDKHNQKTLKLLENLRCTSGLSSAALNLLAPMAVRKTYRSKELIWRMGDPGDCIAILVSGLVEINRYTTNDEEMTIGLFGASDVIGISAVIRKTTYPGEAKVAMDGTEAIKLYIRPILQSQKPEALEIASWVREMLLIHEQVLRDKIDIINAPSVDYRIFELLKNLIRRFGRREPPLGHRIPLQLTRQQIGKLIDVRVETIIRAINRWQKQNLILWKKDGIWIENLSTLEKHLQRGKKRR